MTRISNRRSSSIASPKQPKAARSRPRAATKPGITARDVMSSSRGGSEQISPRTIAAALRRLEAAFNKLPQPNLGPVPAKLVLVRFATSEAP